MVPPTFDLTLCPMDIRQQLASRYGSSDDDEPYESMIMSSFISPEGPDLLTAVATVQFCASHKHKLCAPTRSRKCHMCTGNNPTEEFLPARGVSHASKLPTSSAMNNDTIDGKLANKIVKSSNWW